MSNVFLDNAYTAPFRKPINSTKA